MAQPLSSPHPITQDAQPKSGPERQLESKAASVLPLAGVGLGGLAIVATLALWFHYGTQVFFETIRAGFAACF